MRVRRLIPCEADQAAARRMLLEGCRPRDRPLPLDATLDWDWLARAAERHGVAPLVAASIADQRTSTTTLATNSARLLAVAQAVRLRNQYLVAALTRILDAARDAGLDVTLLKGPALGVQAYGDAEIRSFADLDLLVSREDLPAAARLLEECGYQSDLYDHRAINSGFFDAVEANFRDRDGAVNIDLHWAVNPACYSFGPDAHEVRKRAVDLVINDRVVRAPAPEDHLLLIAVHSSRHGWPALSHVADIAHLAGRARLGWEAVRERAIATRCTRMLNVGLLLAHDCLGAEVPNPLLSVARTDRGAGRLAAAIASGFGQTAEAGRLGWRATACVAGVSDRSVTAIRHAFAPTLVDWRWWPLRPSLYPLYYVLRPLRLVRRLIDIERLSGTARRDN